MVLTCKEIGPIYGNTKRKGFFSTVAKVSFIICNLPKNFLKHLSINDAR